MSICNEVERNFEDYAFLKKYGIDRNDVDFDIGDGDLDSEFNNLKMGSFANFAVPKNTFPS